MQTVRDLRHLAGGRDVAHRVQRVEAFLGDVDQPRLGDAGALHDSIEQVLEIVAQVADGAHAGEPRAALDGVQVALQGTHRLRGTGAGAPRGHCTLGFLQDLGGFLAEQREDLGIERLHRRQRDGRAGFGAHLVLLVQRADGGGEFLVRGTRRLAFIERLDHCGDGVHRAAHQRETGLGQSDMVVMQPAQVFVERPRDDHGGRHVSHVGAAGEGVRGAVRRLGHGVGRGAQATAGDELAEVLEVAAGLAREDIAQHRVHLGDLGLGCRWLAFGFGLWLRLRPLAIGLAFGSDFGFGLRFAFGFGFGQRRGFRFDFCFRFSFGLEDRCLLGHAAFHERRQSLGRVGPVFRKGVGLHDPGLHVEAGSATGLELLDQHRHEADDPREKLHQRLGALDAALQHGVHQPLDGPGVFANQLGADHAAAALQGVEIPPHGAELRGVAVGDPARKVHADGLVQLARFLDEQLEQLRIRVLVALVHRRLGLRRRRRNRGQRRDFLVPSRHRKTRL